jgi:hypothetical protein
MDPSGAYLRKARAEGELQRGPHAQQELLDLLSGWRSHLSLSFEISG